MSDGLRALRWRAATLTVAVGIIFAWVWMSGRHEYVIQVDYTWTRGLLEGAEVEIDGTVAGVLQPYGRNNPVTGFRVEPGEHIVRVHFEDCISVPDTVLLDEATRFVTFMADVDEAYECRVVLW